MKPTTTASANSHHPPSQSSPTTAGRPTTATMIRDQKLLIELASSSAEAALAAGVLLERGVQVAFLEVRPEPVHEDELRVGELPEEEVRDPLLAGRPDEQVRLEQLRVRERGGEGVLVHVLRRRSRLDQTARGVHQLRPAAVVECDPEVDAVVPF